MYTHKYMNMVINKFSDLMKNILRTSASHQPLTVKCKEDEASCEYINDEHSTFIIIASPLAVQYFISICFVVSMQSYRESNKFTDGKLVRNLENKLHNIIGL